MLGSFGPQGISKHTFQLMVYLRFCVFFRSYYNTPAEQSNYTRAAGPREAKRTQQNKTKAVGLPKGGRPSVCALRTGWKCLENAHAQCR